MVIFHCNLDFNYLKMTDLKQLIFQRGIIKGRITRFQSYVKNLINAPITNIICNELNIRLSKMEQISIEYDQVQGKIEALNELDIESELDERDQVESQLCSAIATAQDIVDRFQKQGDMHKDDNRSISMRSGSDSNYCHHNDINVKLTIIQIPKFNGSFKGWLEFRDMFTSLIHSQTRLQPVHKFRYLLSYLEGDAARLLGNLEVSDANYEVAWKLLCDRYNNKDNSLIFI